MHNDQKKGFKILYERYTMRIYMFFTMFIFSGINYFWAKILENLIIWDMK